MNRGPKVAGIVAGAAAGLLAAGAAAGIAAQRHAIGRLRMRPDTEAREPFGRLRGHPLTVLADDGVPLHVEIDGDDEAAVTVVFCHGYGLRSDSWHYQRRYLRHLGRLVFWDQRSHGRSGRSADERCNIDQLGKDLYAVLNAAVPRGPVVLVGHSMGGMTIMALADQHPELFGDHTESRVGGATIVGVGLVATSADPVHFVGHNFSQRLDKVSNTVVGALGKQVGFVEGARRLGSDLMYLLVHAYSFGSAGVSPSVAAFQDQMVREVPIDVLAAFFPVFAQHERRSALPVIDRVESLVVAGDEDRLTPISHAETIVARLHGAEYVVVPGAGHMVMLEDPGVLNEAIGQLVHRAMLAADSGKSA